MDGEDVMEMLDLLINHVQPMGKHSKIEFVDCDAVIEILENAKGEIDLLQSIIENRYM